MRATRQKTCGPQWNGCGVPIVFAMAILLVHCITPGMVRPSALSRRRNARKKCWAANW